MTSGRPGLGAVLAAARADYLERVRRNAFLITLGVTVWFAYVALPPQHARYITMQIAGTRGIYDSAYVGPLVALLTTIFLSIVGFYLVNDAVGGDRRTRVGLLLAATPLGRAPYTVAKAASNAALLATIVLVVAVASAGMQLLRGEASRIDWPALLLPHLFVTLPAMTVVAALAVAFETIPFLAGALGNVVYFVVVMGLLAPSMENLERGGLEGDDLLGSRMVLGPLLADHARAFPELRERRDHFSLGFNFRREGTWELRTFRWRGIAWTPSMALPRLRWVALALAIAIAAALPFDRFDPARARRRGRRKARAPAAGAEESEAPRAPAAALPSIDALAPAVRRAALAGLLRAELRLMLRGVPRAWGLVGLGLALATWLAPLDVARGILLPAAWIWPLTRWSAMGAREQLHGVAPLVWSAPRPLGRQLLAVWLAGLTLTVALGLGVGARLALAQDSVGLAAWSTGALFIPTMALALGVWTGGTKAFEVLYLALWYTGPINRVPALDYLGATAASALEGGWRRFAVAAAALLVAAVLGRRRQLRR